MSVIFMDTRTAIPAQLVLLVAETGVHAIQHLSNTLCQRSFGLRGCKRLSVLVSLHFLASLSSGSLLTYQCFWNLLDTESMVSSFRRMLRLAKPHHHWLLGDMTVCKDTDCLKHLLMTQGNFKGKNFERLLVPEQVGRFRDFLKQSMAEAQKIREPRHHHVYVSPCVGHQTFVLA